MKNNQPITDKEIKMEPGQVIVTRTDLKGTITYANQAFIDISGYSEQELLGNNHNMVRHPDMPTEAFKDLWSTLKNGDPWVGIIKNRCKNGDYYWVEAHVTPIYKNGQVVEFMSFRKQPTQDKINQAQTLYQEISAGNASIKPTGVKKLLDYAKNRMKLSARLGLSIGLVVTMLTLLILFSSQQMKVFIEKTDHLHETSFAVTTDLLKVTDNILKIQHAMNDITRATSKRQINELSTTIDAYESETILILNRIKEGIVIDKDILHEASKLFVDWKKIRDSAISHMLADEQKIAKEIANVTSAQHIFTMFEGMQKIIDHNISKTDEFMTNSSVDKKSALKLVYILLGITLLLSIIMTFVIVNTITKPLKKMIQSFRQLQDNPLEVDINLERKDELGKVMLALKSVQIKLGNDIKASEEKAEGASRIKQALDNVNGNVMVTDNSCSIVYMNDAVRDMMSKAESDLQKDLTGFNASKLMGADISIFYKDDKTQGIKLCNMPASYSEDLIVGGRHLRMISNPVKNINKERIGTVIECIDRTQQVKVEEEIQSIVTAALSGDLSQRISLDNKSEFLKTLSKGVNDLVGVNENVINDTVRVMSSMAQGDLTQTINADYQGLYGQLQSDVNQTINKLTSVLGEISDNAVSVMNGANEIAQGNSDLSQRTEEQASSLEQTASSMEQMTSTVRQNADNAREANQLATEARTQAEKGGDVLNNAVSAMNEITKSSRKIADIISVIDEIAFQTNLLALNAAVEAARAGEQGRGFAVVASEVRNLAGRSATAAKEIKALIADSEQKVSEGSKLVDDSGKTLEDITSSVKKVSDIIAEIAAAGEEQSIGIEQVNKAVSQMDEMTQQNAALVEQAAAASEDMGERARSLSNQVGFFTTDGNSSTQQTGDRRSSSRPWSDSAPANNANSSAGETRLDFASARTKHMVWKTKLRKFLDGKESMSESQAVSHQDCELGKWIYSTAMSEYGHHSEIQRLEKSHKNLHNIIKDVVRYKNSGDVDNAEAGLAKVNILSGEIIDLLNKSEEKITGAGSTGSNTTTQSHTQQPAIAKQVATASGGDNEWEEF